MAPQLAGYAKAISLQVIQASVYYDFRSSDRPLSLTLHKANHQLRPYIVVSVNPIIMPLASGFAPPNPVSDTQQYDAGRVQIAPRCLLGSSDW